MGEAKRKKEAVEREDRAVQGLLPEEVRPAGDYLFLRPKNAAEAMRGGNIILPANMAGLSTEARLKKQFGTVVERPRFVVVSVGPDVKGYEAGQEVLIDRMAVISKGTAINLTGFGIYFMCREENICGYVEPLPDDEAEEIVERYKREREGRQAEKPGFEGIDRSVDEERLADQKVVLK